jgi:hypothetical protein
VGLHTEEFAMTPYMQQLLAAPDQIQDAIEQALHDYQIVPVGTGYFDLIVQAL